MDAKEIVFISNFFGNGGAARVISVLAEGFALQGYRVSICSYACKGVEEYGRVEGVSHIELTFTHKKGIKNRIERISALRKELKKHPGAIVIAFEYFVNMQTIVACFGLKNRIIVSERNDPARLGGKFPTSVLRNILYSFCDTLVCQTPDAKAYFPKWIQRKSVIIPNPIKEHLPEPYAGERVKKIVNFCRLEKQKNLPLLIDAFAAFSRKHMDYTLHIYGDGKEKDFLEQYIRNKKLGHTVFLHAAMPDIHQEVLNAGMFVSSSDYEGMSNSMLEAMGIGLPTICTDCPCGGAGMVIQDHKNGLLVPVGDAEALCRAMTEVAEDSVLADKLSANAVKIKNDLSVQRILEKWKNAIE